MIVYCKHPKMTLLVKAVRTSYGYLYYQGARMNNSKEVVWREIDEQKYEQLAGQAYLYQGAR